MAMIKSSFYREQAEACALEAENATLANVRDRSKRSEEAWLQMAKRASDHEVEQEKLAEEKAMRTEDDLPASRSAV